LEHRIALSGESVTDDWASALFAKLAPQAAAAQPITIASSLPVTSGYPRTTTNTVSLTGTADPSATLITVGGQSAVWNPGAGTWSVSNLAVKPGINRIVARAYQDSVKLNETFIDIWYDTGTTTSLSGTIASNRTLTADAGPYLVTGDVTVPVGVTLTIEPGTTIYFNNNTGIRVNGRLLAEGTDANHIRFTRRPGQTNRWDGIELVDTLQDNRMRFFDQEYGDQQGHSIGVDHSKLTIEYASWAFANRTVIEVDHPSLLVKNSHFPAIGGGEVVHGEHISGSEYLILDGNVFDKGTSSDDIIDFLGSDRPGPVFQVLNNIFLGGRDDGLDLDGTDAHIEGNIFTGFKLGTTRPTTSNAIATGLPQTGETNRTQITVVRNLFYDNHHAILLKEDAFATVVNNVFADLTYAAIQVNELNGTLVEGPGRGAYLDGNIVYNVPELFKNVEPSTQLAVHRSIVPAADVGRGVGNLAVDPLFNDPANRDYTLQINSPARGTGPNGRDMGAYVNAGASIAGEPSSPTTDTSATLTVGGPDIYGYKYRINDGPWSAEVPTQNVETLTPTLPPIVLTNLAPGTYYVDVIAKNSAGVWQSEFNLTRSKGWIVIAEPATVVGRHVFYNQSKFDGDQQQVGPADDAAIATDKVALLPGQTSSFANYTSYNQGISGIMVDVDHLLGSVSPNDFTFRVGNSSDVSQWATVLDPPFVFVRPGEGVGGSTRVTLIPRLPIRNTWLQVTVKANENTGLATADVFYFGNAVGESGDAPGDYSVSILDELLARNNPVSVVPGADVTNRFDYNRDGTVSVIDQLLARNNLTTVATKLQEITVPAAALRAEGLTKQSSQEAAISASALQDDAPTEPRHSASNAPHSTAVLSRSIAATAVVFASEAPDSAAADGNLPTRRCAEVDSELLELLSAR
jgi:hypothetical protein